MNGIKKITDKIAAEAQAEVDSILSEAAERADAVAAEYAALAQTEEQELLRAGQESADSLVQRQERNARLEAKKDVLAAKQELISRAYELAKEKILSMDEDRYVEFLARQAAEAALTGKEEIILSAADRQRLGEKLVRRANALAAERGLPGELKLSAQSRDMAGGLALRQGNIEVNCTLDKLLEISRGRLDAEVASILFR